VVREPLVSVLGVESDALACHPLLIAEALNRREAHEDVAELVVRENTSDLLRDADPPHRAIGHYVPLLSTLEHLRETLAASNDARST
jgi:hypothetical protein